MSATISAQSLTGVSKNAFIIRDGKLIIQNLELSRRTSKHSGAQASDLGNFHKFYAENASTPINAIDGNGDLIQSVVTSRSSNAVELVLPESDQSSSGMTDLCDELEDVFYGTQDAVDYVNPTTDLLKTYDFVGTYNYTEGGTQFVVSSVTVST